MLLPITNYQKQIIEAVRNHSITIISAETGSGKSTQIPQYLADYYNQIVITQPRIMAAKSLARRVAEEMNVKLGREVGYLTACDKCFSSMSKILFCTDGLQLIRTIFNKDTKTENVLIIDEVHEWNLNVETLIAWCKFMQGKWNTKVVIMSATLDTSQLADFFDGDVAVLNIPGTLYDVSIEERLASTFIDTIKENINKKKNILVFVAGKKEISNVMKALSEEDTTILPLHGKMDWDDQKKCFEHYPNPKVVVATNVAQTSLTIPDIDVVVDSGNARISIVKDGIQGLFLKDISISEIMQRKGRAGRTKSGKYFLCSNIPMTCRNKYSIPEIQRSILDRVVLQLAEIGLDAEKLEFYHQPETTAIVNSKKELRLLGAISGDHVTEIGHKIVKIPVSVQLARMIIEAEKYGVTEPVITIAAIIEMGGLLSKNVSYYRFTSERKSDLLAELDVWTSINKMTYIDFKNLGINKKTFFKIRELIKKLKKTLFNIVEMSNNNDRESILKSCLHGLVSNIYVKSYDRFYSDGETNVLLDKNSCLFGYSNFIVGIPKTIEFMDRFEYRTSINLVSFASEIDLNTLIELVPNSINEETTLRYSINMNAVEITTKKRFAGVIIDTKIKYDNNHPAYTELKAKYENFNSYSPSANNQEFVVIDGKQFKVHHNFMNQKSAIFIDNETLFSTKQKEIFLDSGEKVYLCSSDIPSRRKETSVVALRNAVEMYRISILRQRKKDEYKKIKIIRLTDVLTNASKLGKIQLTMNNGGYGNTPILVYGYIVLKKKTVTFNISDDEELAKSNTLESLQFLFLKEIEKKYGNSKFSHQKGKNKKVLTASEIKLKSDFDSLVRELILDLTVENALETLDFIDDYYQELIS